MLLLASLYFCIFLSAFNVTCTIMSSSYVIGELGGSFNISFYSTVFFALGSALTFPIAAHIGKHFGKHHSLKTSLILFFIFTYLCSLSSTYFLFILARFICGCIAGAFYPLALGLINEILPKEKDELSFAFLALLMSLTPVIGACFGGWIAYDYHWTWIFHLQQPAIALCFLAIFMHHKERLEKTQKDPFDSIGYFFYILSTGSFVIAICLGQELDWFRSPFITSLFTLSLISSCFFILWSWKHEAPLINIRLFKIPLFSLCILLDFFLFSTYFGLIILLSQWLQFDASYTPLWISLLLLHMIFAGIFLFYFMLKWMKKISPFVAVFFSIVSLALSCFYSTTFSVDTDFYRIAISRVLAGFGLAFFLYPLYSICLGVLSKEQKQQGVVVFQSCRLLGGALGISAYTTIWYRRGIFYHDRLGSSLTAYSELTREFFTKLSFFGPEGLEAKAFLDKGLQSQSTVLALADTSYLMGWILVILLVLFSIYWARTKLSTSKG